MRVWLSGRAERPLRLAGVSAALDQHRVLAGGGGQGQLVDGHDLAAVLQDALTGFLGHAEGGDLEEEKPNKNPCND